MTIIVEDGTGLSNAESLVSVTYFKDYHSARGNASVAALTTAQSEEALRRASDYFLQTYRGRWQGERTTTTQALDWPRVNVVVDYYKSINDNEIPNDIKNAFSDLAFKAVSGELLSDVSSQVIRQKVEGIEVEYQPNTRQTKRYTAIDAMLSQYLKGNGAVNLSLVRS